MKTEAEIRRALVGWRAAASIELADPEDPDEQTREEVADIRRHARHHVEALEWVLGD